MKVIKRDGLEVEFDKDKIENAILKAMKNGSGIIKVKIAQKIAEEISEFSIQNLSVAQIEKLVYDLLIKYKQKDTARAYERFRAVQEFKRNNNTTDESILSLLNKTNEDVMKENSNKNSVIASTQRDLIAGEVSKDIAKRKLIPTHIVQAHEEGAIHYHDLDYSIQNIFNCFSGDTKFITSLGVKSFSDCGHGQELEVLDKNGKWRKATVKQYGKQKLQTVTISSGRTTRNIRCTYDHRWLLKNGEFTTNLNIGDKLHLLEETETQITNPYAFCLGFAIGDGSDYNNKTSHGMRVRLCGEKVSYLDMFLKCGYTVSEYRFNNSDDILLFKSNENSKNNFIENKVWRYMSKDDLVSLFLGYYSADGFKDRNGIATSNDNIALMIREISALAGYHITSENFEVRNTPYKDNARLYTFRFMKSQPSNRNWIVKDIDRTDSHLYNVWCVEEPITKTFTLNGGVVTGNCCLINLQDMLDNGTVINDKLVESPKSFSTACTITTQIMAQVASNQYGGQSITIAHLAPYLRKTRDKAFRHYYNDLGFNAETSNKLSEDIMMKELKDGVQTIRYQLSTLQTTNGQAPFATIYLEIQLGSKYEEEMALICEEMIKQRLEGMKNYKGQEIGEAFPKLVYLLDEHNCLEGGKYDYITKLSAKCNAKRLVPDYQSAKIMRENYEGNTFPPMGCRSHLSPWKDENGNYKWYGRFNQGVVSLNLPQIAILSNGNLDTFWDILNQRLELCKEALLVRHNHLLGTLSDTSPIHWQHGAIARLNKGEKIDKLLKDGYSTLSLGYVGICEMTYSILGISHTTPEGEKFALEVMNYMNDRCKVWKNETGLGFSLYSSPAENLIYRFCKIDKQRFGSIPNVTDRLYYTNSYHVHVCEEIDAFSKLKFESQFHGISLGGCISYVEVPDMSKNLDAIEQIINFIYNNIQYSEINTKPDICYKCGFTGEIKNDDNLEWYCPNCGNRDESEMQVMRRTCGYIGTNYWNKGRTAEIKDRVIHL